MSLLDQIEKQLIGRLMELEPLRREYERLRKAAERLGIKYSPAASEQTATTERSAARASSGQRAARTAGARAAKSAEPSERTRSTPSQRARKAPTRASRSRSGARGSRSAGGAARRSGRRRAPGARPGQRQEDVLRLVAERPGITVREIGAQLGVDATGLYRVANRLTADGRIRKDGTGLYPIESGPAGTVSGAGARADVPEAPASGIAEGDRPSEAPGAAEAAGTPEAAEPPTASRSDADRAAGESPTADQ